MEIGFIGLGAMGRAMAARLLSAGHRLRVWNRSPGPARELAGQGAEAVAAAAEAFRGDVAITMLADDAACRSVGLAGPLLDQAPRGLIHLNMATVSVELTRELAGSHAERGLFYLAAPVFGRGEVAAAGKLTIVASGPSEMLDRVAPLLDAMGQRTWRLGADPSQAAAAKIAGNFMIASVIETIGEATILAARHGVPAETLLEVLTSSLFSAPVYKNYGAIIAGTPRLSRVPSTPWTSRRGPPSTSGSAVATSACSGVPRPTFWASAIRRTIRALLSSGSRCRVALSISASRSGRRRSTSPEIAMASA